MKKTSIRQAVTRRTLSLAHAVAQRIIPPTDNNVVFTSIPDHSDNSFAVYRHLLRTRRNLRTTWIVVDLDARQRIEQEFAQITADIPGHGHRLSVHSRHGWRGYLAYLRARVAFHTHGVFAFARSDHRRHIVSLWHGMPIKAIGQLNTVTPSFQLPHGTTHLATSEMFRYIIAACFDVDPDDVMLANLPRTDALLADTPAGPAPEEIRARLGLDAERRIIFWMPTYRTQANGQFVTDANRTPVILGQARTFLDDVPDELLETLDRACGDRGCQIIIKLHPLDALNHESRVLPYENMRLLASDDFLASGLQLYDVLAECDALMSDLSSVVIDFMPTGRPIGLIGLPFDVYERNLILPLELFAESPRFDHLQEPADVEGFVRAVAEGERHAEDSFTTMLNPRREVSGCEQVLRQAGL